MKTTLDHQHNDSVSGIAENRAFFWMKNSQMDKF
jgi:hypothetical protein